MSITRRSFLLGTASAGAGFILPGHFDQVFAFLQNHGEPLLQAPPNAAQTLFAYRNGCPERPDQWRLSLGDYFTAKQSYTWREVFERYGLDCAEYYYDSDEEMAEDLGFASVNELLDSEADFDKYENQWYLHDSPFTRAYDLLNRDEIGAVLSNGSDVGHLLFEYAPGMNSVPGGIVDAADTLTLSLLQCRLNELGESTAIKLDA